MRILKTSLLLISVLIFTTASAPAKKHVYKTEEGKFSITFPAEYTTEREEKESATTIKTSCVDDGHTFFASYTLHVTEITDHQEMAEVSYESFISAVQGELLSKSKWNIKDHEGLKAVMNISDNSMKLEYRVVLVGNIQYQLVAMAMLEEYDEKAAARYFKSFKLYE
jgi:hypothetical protein